ncbi:MAG: hypothetical protein PHU25_19265 [Deltaproteobacteria bacterium]|nr:hypothetical protein [Deltaproteobacteria bacterium]
MRRALPCFLAISCLVLCACPSQVTTAARAPVAPQRALPTDLLGPRMDAIGERLRTQGFTPAGIESGGAISSGERIVFAVPPTKAAQRLVLVAIGRGQGLSLDLVARKEDETTASDTAPDDRAAIEIPVGAGEGLQAELVATAGRGEALTRVFTAKVDTAPARLGDLFDADLVPRSSWRDALARARGMGFAVLGAPRNIAVRRGGREVVPVRLEADTCYLLVAVGSAGVDRIAMRLKRDRTLLAADPSGRPEAWIRTCADENADAGLSVETAAGAGSITLGWFAARRADLGPDGDPPLRPAAPEIGFDALARLSAQDMERHGLDDASATTILDERLVAGDRRVIELDLVAGECAIISAVAEPSVADLDLSLRAADESLVAASRTGAFGKDVGTCARADATYAVRAIALVGEGRVVLRLQRLPGPAFETTDPGLALAGVEAMAAFARVGLVPTGELVPLTRDVENGGRFSGSVSVGDGTCHGLALLGGTGPRAFAALGSDGERIASARSENAPAMMVVCDRKENDLVVEAEAAHPEAGLYVLIFSSRLDSPGRNRLSTQGRRTDKQST